jgi:small subunit ribosomal protein S4
MARHTGSVCKLCRREGVKLFLKGERCFTDNCAIERRPYPPGQHGKRSVKLTPYAQMLREKQKAKRIYGVLEAQFVRYFDTATRMPGKTGENLLILLERRLDNVIYRAGFASSRREARQFVRHNHFYLNGRKVNIPSYLVDPGDVIELSPSGKENIRLKEILETAGTRAKVPSWLDVNYQEGKIRVLALPSREEINIPVDENKIVELYSK